MTTTFKPMLAASLDDVALDNVLKFPLLASPKLDGVRCITMQRTAFSRNMKPIRNKYVQAVLGETSFQFDGELVVGDPTGEGVFNRTQSGVMSEQGTPDFTYYIFDHLHDAVCPFELRLAWLSGMPKPVRTVFLAHKPVNTMQELLAYEAEVLAQGYEGVMLRHPRGPYKYGRSTLNEGWLFKLKRFTDGEGLVIDLEEAEHNENEAFKDELGRTKRTTHKANKRGAGMVGTLLVNTPEWGVLRVAPGVMTHEERAKFFANPSQIVGKTVQWRAFGYGIKDKPRFARYYGIRLDLQ